METAQVLNDFKNDHQMNPSVKDRFVFFFFEKKNEQTLTAFLEEK